MVPAASMCHSLTSPVAANAVYLQTPPPRPADGFVIPRPVPRTSPEVGFRTLVPHESNNRSFLIASVMLLTTESALTEKVCQDHERRQDAEAPGVWLVGIDGSSMHMSQPRPGGCVEPATRLQLLVLHMRLHQGKWVSRAQDNVLRDVGWKQNLPGQGDNCIISFLRWCSGQLGIECATSHRVTNMFDTGGRCLVCAVRLAPGGVRKFILLLTTWTRFKRFPKHKVVRANRLQQGYRMAAYMWYNEGSRRFQTHRVWHGDPGGGATTRVEPHACVLVMYTEDPCYDTERSGVNVVRVRRSGKKRRRNPFATEKSAHPRRSLVAQLAFELCGNDRLVTDLVNGEPHAVQESLKLRWSAAEDEIVQVRCKCVCGRGNT